MGTTLAERVKKAQERGNWGCTSGLTRGYYLVTPGGIKRWFSARVDERLLEKACKQWLDASFNYWIDYSYGPDVYGNAAWSNLDQTDEFI